jgi:hypothetical protein
MDGPGRACVGTPPTTGFVVADSGRRRTKGLKCAADGSLDIYVQHDSPGKHRESNGLPAPRGPYDLIARIYGPSKSAVDGTWKFPVAQKP